MNPAGSSQTNLTNHPARDIQPDWQPVRTVGGFSRDLDIETAPENAPLTPSSATSLVTFAAVIGSASLAAAWYARRRQRARI